MITFSYDLKGNGEKHLITHYLASFQDGKIKTRSNQTEHLDYWEIDEKDILGKVQYVIPKLGYLFIPVFKPLLIHINSFFIDVNDLKKTLLLRWLRAFFYGCFSKSL